MFEDLFSGRKLQMFTDLVKARFQLPISLESIKISEFETLCLKVKLSKNSEKARNIFSDQLVEISKQVDINSEILADIIIQLRNLLPTGISSSALKIFQDRARIAFTFDYEPMLKSGYVDREARQSFVERCYKAGISEAEVTTLFQTVTKPFIQPLVDEAMTDGLYSPEEQERLEAISQRLGIDEINLSPSSNAVLAAARRRWELVNGEMPIVDSPLMLERGETCHAKSHAKAYEPRTRTVKAGYHGPSARIRIAKGLSYNLASYKVSREVETYNHLIGSGWLVVTNKRMIFVGDVKSVNIALGKIVDWTFFSDGIEIQRASGKPITFVAPRGMTELNEILIVARSKLLG